MLQQQSREASHANSFMGGNAGALRSLAYRSVAVATPTATQLQELLRVARQRNKEEGLSGVLLCDHDAFFQWLEGPSAALSRVWESISRDPRHHQVTVLRDEPISRRVFDGWDMHIARGAQVSIEAAVAAIHSSSAELLKHLVAKSTSRHAMSLEDVFATSVIPRLLEAHPARRESTRKIWHAESDSGAKLAQLLLEPHASATARYMDSLLEQGASFNALCHDVFEPAQLHLGRLWDADRCDDFLLSLGLARLHVEVRRANAAVPGKYFYRPGHRVLLCPQPGESHSAGLLMSSEIFDRNGWDVTCELPGAGQTLLQVVHEQWFDVLKVSQSGSLRRDSRLLSMRDTIDAARLASLNPALIVVVDGRTFAENPHVYEAVHANAAARSVLDAVPVAERLLRASRSPLASVQVSVS